MNRFPDRRVHVKRGQTVLVKAGAGVELEVRKFPSGAVTLRNALTGSVLRAWSPKEARSR